MTKKVLLIGGGTGGHILPLASLLRELEKSKAGVELIVADAPLDKKLVEQSFPNATVHYFKTDKIRRYLSVKNLAAPFKIIASIFRAHSLIKKSKPSAIFFKGGFVGFPFLIAARVWHREIKLFSHESDLSPGALTKFASRWCHASFESFGEKPMPLFYSPEKKLNAPQKSEKQKLLILGGSQGAQWINQKLEKECAELTKQFDTLLVSGQGKSISCKAKNFRQVELLPADELAQELHNSDIVISRAGANSLFEIISAKKPSIIVPLPSAARDHQTLNANWFAEKGLCHVLLQSSENSLAGEIKKTQNDKILVENLNKSTIKNAATEIAETILKSIKKK